MRRARRSPQQMGSTIDARLTVVSKPRRGTSATATEITPRGARLLYVAMTRAVQELHFVTDAEPPPVLNGG